MSKRILHIRFPDGISHIYLDGKKYTRQEFNRAKELERRRDKFGRFSSEVGSTKIQYPEY